MTQRNSHYDFVVKQHTINATPERFKLFARELVLEIEHLRQNGFDMRELMPDLLSLVAATGLTEKEKTLPIAGNL